MRKLPTVLRPAAVYEFSWSHRGL